MGAQRTTTATTEVRSGSSDRALPGPAQEGPASGFAAPARELSPEREARWLWATLALSSASIVAVVFAVWELLENRFFRGLDYVTLHSLYITRGVASSLLLACWAAWYVLRQKRRTEAELRRSREYYRRILDASPGALVLYGADRRVVEWNATAERLYGFPREEVLGRPLPTVPEELAAELEELLARVGGGAPVVELETRRRRQGGEAFDVELTLLPFRDLSGRDLVLEASSDIRERVRLRAAMLEIEKLASMGQMAAGTAHHLNTPLAAMLLRVQMMRDRLADPASEADLAQLESGVAFCQNFVRRLLDFSRRPAGVRQPQPLTKIVESVASFLAPSFTARRARVRLDLAAAEGVEVLADRNLLEALFAILLSNSVDAIAVGGSIEVRCPEVSPERIVLEILDDGCGFDPASLPRAFEPFFTTKGPGKGTGLGLAIARNILIEAGGSIRLESAPGRGTRAIVELPPHRGAASAEARAS